MCIVWDRVFGCGHYTETNKWDKCRSFILSCDCPGDKVIQQFVPHKCWLCSARLRAGRQSLGYIDVGVSGDVEAAVTADHVGRMLGPINIKESYTEQASSADFASGVARARTFGGIGNDKQGYLIERAGTFGKSGDMGRSQGIEKASTFGGAVYNKGTRLIDKAGTFGTSKTLGGIGDKRTDPMSTRMSKTAGNAIGGNRGFGGQDYFENRLFPEKPITQGERRFSGGYMSERTPNEFGYQRL